MKRYAFYMLVMAVAAVAACQKESAVDNAQEPAQKTYTYTVKASIDDVKSDYDADGKFSWSAGDAISVLFHKGDDNKFFTLTTAASGTASASFSGEIETGYVIGASDQTVEDKKIWALFPASNNHTYTAGSNPNFYVQPEWDFTAPGAHFSANIPMYALLAVEGDMAFANLASTYKITVNNIDASINKVRLEVSNQTTYGLSGSWPIHNDKYINYNYADPGSANSCLAFTRNVTEGKAVFYISCRYWGTFQPIIKVYDARNTNDPLKTVTATNAKTPTSMTKVQPLTISAPGTVYVPIIAIDGLFSDWDGISEYSGGSGNTRINAWRVAADKQNVYIYAKLVTEKITHDRYFYIGFDTEEGGSDHGGIAGLEQYCVIYPAVASSSPVEFIQGTDPRSTVNGSSDGTLKTWGVFDGTYSYVEMCIPRSKVSISSAGTIQVAISYNSYATAKQTLVLE